MKKNSKIKHKWISIRKIVSIGRICEAENWLRVKGLEGLVLQNVQDGLFNFKSDCPTDSYFFMLNPEKGSDNSIWLYYDFLNAGAQKIPFYGTSFVCPRYILRISMEKYSQNKPLFDYLYEYRNYRLLRRIILNIVLSLFFVTICLIVCFLKGADLAMVLCGIVSFLVGVVNCTSLINHMYSSSLTGSSISLKKPKRPQS